MVCHPWAVRSAEAPAPGAPASPAPLAAPKPAPTQPRYSILEFRVEGNTLLAVPDVERAVMPFLGENRGIEDVEGARKQLEKAYQDRGYKTVIVNIPQQRINGGVVRLKVLEAPVGKLRILGSRYHSLSVIRDKVAQFDPGTVPNFPEVQKELGTVNRSADLRVTPVLRASETPGKVDVDLRVEDHLPLHALLDVDNRYSANTTHLRTTGSIHYDNLFQLNQSLNLQYQIAPVRTSDAKIASLSYVIPMAGGPVWALYAIHSDSNVAAVGNLDVIGAGNIFGVRWIDPLPGSSVDFYHSFTAGADYKDFKQSVILEGATTAVESPVKYPAFSLAYSGTWVGPPPPEKATRAATPGGRSDTSVDVGISFLIRGLGTDWHQFANKRANAGTSFIVLHPSITREQVLPASWSMVAKIDGQLASGPLINNEQYAAGGAESVRGYTEAERLGDNAFRGSLELRTPQWLAAHFARIDQAYLAAFAESAKVITLRALPKQEASYTLASAGLSLRFKSRGFYCALDGARILEGGLVTPKDRFRGLFKFTYEY